MSDRRLWLTIDSDDIRHLPRHQGHPTRSRRPPPRGCQGREPSVRLLEGMQGFSRWFAEGGEATLFLIAEQLDSKVFSEWLESLLQTGRLRIGCHGNTHRSWSAWPEDVEGFRRELSIATQRLQEFSGQAWRPWFRAPAGYIAPWMAAVLAEQGYTVDSSVNPSPLLVGKTGLQRSWRAVTKAIEEQGLVERKWLTSSIFGIRLPACGPALHKMMLGRGSKRLWLSQTALELATDEEVENPCSEVVTVYWHLLDHSRESGLWSPPLG